MKYREYFETLTKTKAYLEALNHYAMDELSDKLYYRRCPVCNNPNHEARKNNNIRYSTNLLTFVKCSTCGLIYSDMCLNPFNLENFYRNNDLYRSMQKPKAQIQKSPIVNTILRCTKDRDLCLEIGCGYGELLAQLKPFFASVVGLELHESLCTYAREHYDISVLNKDLTETYFPYQSCDVIILNQVLEHIHPIKPLFFEIKRILKKDGIIYLGVPTMDSISASVLKDAHIHLATLTHLNFFNRQSIAYLCDLFQFKILEFKTSNLLDLQLIDLCYFVFFRKQFMHRFTTNKLLTPLSLAVDFALRPIQNAGIIQKLEGGSYLEIVVTKQ